MKIVICGDTHIGAVFGLGGRTSTSENSRVSDYEKTLNEIIDEAIRVEAKLFIQTGDAFEFRTPSAWHMSIWNRALYRLSSNNITSVILMGNHDYIRNGESYTSSLLSLAAADYPNVKIILKPQIVSIATVDGSVDLVAIPFRDRKMYGGKTTKEDSELYDFEVKSLIDQCDKKGPIIAVGHNFVYENGYGAYGGTEILTSLDTYKDCDMVAMGHYHDIKKFKKEKPIAFYTGAMERTNFGDKTSNRGYFIFDTKSLTLKAKKSNVRNLIELELDIIPSDISSYEDEISNFIKNNDVHGKIVRFHIKVNTIILSSIKKNKISRLLYDNGAHYVSRILIEPVSMKIVADSKILSEKTDYGMFKAYLESQSLSDEERNIILKYSNSIIGSN